MLGVNSRNSSNSCNSQSARPLALFSLVALLVLSFAFVLPVVSGSYPAAEQNEETAITRKLLESANPEQTKTSAADSTDVKESGLSGKEADVVGSNEKSSNPTSDGEELYRGWGGGRGYRGGGGYGRGFGGYGRGRGFGGRYGEEEVAEYDAIDASHGGKTMGGKKKMTQSPDGEQLYEDGGGYGWDGGYGGGRGGYGWGGDGGYGRGGYGWGGDGGYGWDGEYNEAASVDAVGNVRGRGAPGFVHHRHGPGGHKTTKAPGKH